MKIMVKKISNYEKALKLKDKDIVKKLLTVIIDDLEMNGGMITYTKGEFANILKEVNIKSILADLGRIAIDKTPLLKITETKKILIITDTKLKTTYPIIEELKAKCYIGIPILGGDGNVLAALELFGNTPKTLSQRDLEEIEPYILRLSSEVELELIKSQNKRFKDKIEKIIEKDQLTGLYKREILPDKLEHEFLRAKRYGRPLSCILLEVSNLPDIEDKYGPSFVRYILTEISHTLKRSVRKVDYVFKYGKKEFFMVLPETKIEDTFILAERLRYEIENTTFKINSIVEESSTKDIKVMLSFGLSSYPNNKIHASYELVQMTDRFISQSKSTDNQFLQ